MKKLTLTSIQCNHITGHAGTDDVFIMHQSDGGAPLRYPAKGVFEMTAGVPNPVTPPGLVIYYNYGCYISLWDHDGPLNQVNAADLIGNLGLQSNATSNTYTVTDNDDSNYSLAITIEDAS